MRVLDVITTKRDGHRLSDEQIDWFISNYASGDAIADEQAAALAMAIYLNGMESEELAHWTRAMADSGERLDLGGLDRPTVDKHSTGGVGDKISLILVPLVAACGAAVPQLSGRGLGHTGGTLDKMESIAGWSPNLTVEQMRDQLNRIGGVIAGASADIAPADRKLYSLRDVTGTVSSIPLIASSIMSKKIAEGTSSLTLDVKTGSGAFMTDRADAKLLAETMVELGTANGVATSALVTGMDLILGRAVGNGLEVEEALEVLAGNGPADVIELTVALARDMLALVGIDADPAPLLASGHAMETFERMVSAQGGDLSQGLPRAEHRLHVVSPADGFVIGLEARRVGVAAWMLGAGRAHKEDSVSPTAGVLSLVAPGERVVEGQPVLELHADDPARFAQLGDTLDGAIQLSPIAIASSPIVVDRVVPTPLP